jgi:acetyl-CoA carboxylase biotin carboxyl carrier protein
MPTPVVAEISGTVWSLEVSDGEAVSPGQVLLVIESMKMEIPVEAPAGGVCRLQVAAEASVQEGDVLAQIE